MKDCTRWVSDYGESAPTVIKNIKAISELIRKPSFLSFVEENFPGDAMWPLCVIHENLMGIISTISYLQPERKRNAVENTNKILSSICQMRGETPQVVPPRGYMRVENCTKLGTDF